MNGAASYKVALKKIKKIVIEQSTKKSFDLNVNNGWSFAFSKASGTLTATAPDSLNDVSEFLAPWIKKNL